MKMPSFETNPEQRQKLLNDGFALILGAIPAELLARWRELAERLSCAAILALRESPIPSVYCHYSIKSADYPIPSDMRHSQFRANSHCSFAAQRVEFSSKRAKPHKISLPRLYGQDVTATT